MVVGVMMTLVAMAVGLMIMLVAVLVFVLAMVMMVVLMLVHVLDSCFVAVEPSHIVIVVLELLLPAERQSRRRRCHACLRV